MRQSSTKEKIEEFMRELGKYARKNSRIYLTGGATAVLLDWRNSTIDIDIKPVPDSDEIFQGIAELKNKIHVNVELASPGEFIPPLPGWEQRSLFIDRQGTVEYYHYDFYSQALAKIERGHAQDQKDVQEMLSRGLVDRKKLFQFFESIRPQLIRYPAIDPESFESKVREVCPND